MGAHLAPAARGQALAATAFFVVRFLAVFLRAVRFLAAFFRPAFFFRRGAAAFFPAPPRPPAGWYRVPRR